MDSLSFQSTLNPSRVRSHSTLSSHSTVDHRGAIHKRAAVDRSRSISTSQADRLYSLAVQQSSQCDINQTISSSINWITPQSSPQPQEYSALQPLEAFPQWTVPTPPRSESGVPCLAVDADTTDEPVTTSLSVDGFDHFDHPTASADMRSLGFLLPSQYGSNHFDPEPSAYSMDPKYIPSMQVSQPVPSSGATAYSQTISSSPALYSTRAQDSSTSRRHSELPGSGSSTQSYDHSYRRISSPYDAVYSLAPSQSIPSISGLTHSPLPSPHLGGSSGTQYNSSHPRSPNMYDPNLYSHQPYTAAPSTGQIYASSSSYTPSYGGSSTHESMAEQGSSESIRVLNQRPKPQCWEHGCNGRQFSTFSNLLRHQREKSGSASKSYCPKCGAEFTRTTARNGHMAHDKCTKQRRPSEGGN